jgi:hypothetical protein
MGAGGKPRDPFGANSCYVIGSMPSPLTLQAIVDHPENQLVLHYLGIYPTSEQIYTQLGTDGSPFDEGGQIFFHQYGRRVPASAYCSLSIHNVMVHERTARIFAFHRGRLTVAVRPDFSLWDVPNNDRLRYHETMDGMIDIRKLGPAWVLFSGDDDEDTEQFFLQAYQLAGT